MQLHRLIGAHMSELYFRIGEMEGFTAMDLADKKEGFATPIRELLQNSIDAAREAGRSPCEINVYIETIRKDQIPCIAQYEEALEKGIQTAKSRGSFNANSQQRVTAIRKALTENELPMLLFSDNGSGMPPGRLGAILSDGVSIKSEEWSGGSFGVGHLSSYALSSLRYVLYATKYKDGGETKLLFTGSPILAGHEDTDPPAQRGKRGRIVRQKPDSENAPQFDYPDEFPDFIADKMQSLDSGTLVCMLGLTEDWGDDAEYAIVSNFFHAIAHTSLSVTIHQGGNTKEISDDMVNLLIESRRDNLRKRGDDILSGKVVHQAWQAVKEDSTQHDITLANDDKVYVCIKSDVDSAIVLIRNGMVIARHDCMLSSRMNDLRKDTSFESFTAVIDVDDKDAPKLFKLIKGAESPYHNKLQAKVLGKDEENRLKKLLEELSEKIKENLKKIERDSFPLPLFEVSNTEDAHTIGQAGGQSVTGTPAQNGRVERKKKKKKGKKRNGKKPTIPSRSLPVKTAVRYTDNGDKWKVELRATPVAEQKPNEDVYLAFYLAEDTDNQATRKCLSFGTVTRRRVTTDGKVNEEYMGEIAPKTPLKLGKLNAGENNIVAEVKKPGSIGNMKVALVPVFGLKKHERKKE